jgi:hypothetical protein
MARIMKLAAILGLNGAKGVTAASLTLNTPPSSKARIIVKSAVIVIPLVALLTLGLTGSRYHTARELNVSPMLKVQGLPQHNIFIVDQSDPSFEELFTSLVKIPGEFAEDVKRFSVFITNKSDRTVASYVVKWEFLRADGKTVSSTKAYSQLNSLDGNARNQPPALKPHSSGLVSLINEIQEHKYPATFIGDDSAFPAAKQSAAKNNMTQRINKLHDKLKTSVSWSVTLDGVLFTDGTFVGPDTTGYFDRIKARFDARDDLLREMSDISAKPAEVFNHAKNVPNAERPKLKGLKVSDFYDRSKAELAREIITRQKNMGDQQTIDFIKSESGKPRIQLTKLPDGK